MLVLERRIGETIVIRPPGEEPIYVSVAKVIGNKVYLAFAANRRVRINRVELEAKMLREGVR